MSIGTIKSQMVEQMDMESADDVGVSDYPPGSVMNEDRTVAFVDGEDTAANDLFDLEPRGGPDAEFHGVYDDDGTLVMRFESVDSGKGCLFTVSIVRNVAESVTDSVESFVRGVDLWFTMNQPDNAPIGFWVRGEGWVAIAPRRTSISETEQTDVTLDDL